MTGFEPGSSGVESDNSANCVEPRTNAVMKIEILSTVAFCSVAFGRVALGRIIVGIVVQGRVTLGGVGLGGVYMGNFG